MAACGAGGDDAAAAPALKDLSGDLKDLLEKLAKADWKKTKDVKGKGVTGSIYMAKVDGWASSWVKSDKTFEGMTAKEWTNYNKYLAETCLTDKTIPVAENTARNEDGTVKRLYCVMKMGMMITNRDSHMEITKYKTDINVDDCKASEVTAWTPVAETEKPTASKKPVRMKINSFCYNVETDKGFRTIDFDNYDFGGSLPTKITDKFVGNPNDYITIAKYLANIKKNPDHYKTK